MALFPTTWPALLALAVIGIGWTIAAWRRYPVSFTMAVLCIGVFVVQLATEAFGVGCLLDLPGSGLVRGNCVIAELSFIPPATDATSRALTPFTYMFVHADLLHIAGNMLILLTAGPALEERIGSRNFLVIYVLAGLGAAAASVVLWKVDFFTLEQSYSPNLGASGAIFGVLTGFAVLFPRERLPMVMPFMFFIIWMQAFWVLMLYLAINLVYVFSHTNIAWWGHFAGFLVGLAVAPLLHNRIPKKRAAQALRVDTEALKPLAQHNVQRSALRELERLAEPKTPDDRALAEAWWERFVLHAQCPQCHHRLEVRDGSLVCPRGDYEVRALRT
ncbi:MAG TPA: rhomboid family intramembrane serine protease [Candidatus Thermoplasmatota archaeon]|nr:rhomboid family intramembrane serine protease [Candidatus Thermoplasmatota archaeon]